MSRTTATTATLTLSPRQSCGGVAVMLLNAVSPPPAGVHDSVQVHEHSNLYWTETSAVLCYHESVHITQSILPDLYEEELTNMPSHRVTTPCRVLFGPPGCACVPSISRCSPVARPGRNRKERTRAGGVVLLSGMERNLDVLQSNRPASQAQAAARYSCIITTHSLTTPKPPITRGTTPSTAQSISSRPSTHTWRVCNPQLITLSLPGYTQVPSSSPPKSKHFAPKKTKSPFQQPLFVFVRRPPTQSE